MGKILILGSGSFAGQALFGSLLREGHDVYGINRSSLQTKGMWPWIDGFEEESLRRSCQLNICSDLDKISSIIDELGPSLIFDFMGQGMVAQSWEDPELWFDTNVSKKAALLKHISRLKTLKLYIRASTPEVYGSSDSFIKPDSEFNPSTPYAISHAGIDWYVRALGRETGFPYILARFANFYGVGQQLYRVIPRLILSCLTNKSFILQGGGTTERSFIYSSDIVSAFRKLLEKGEAGQEFHFSTSESKSISEIVDIVCAIAKVDRSQIVQNGPQRQGIDQCYRLDCTSSKDLLGWSPSVCLESGIAETYAWISNNIEYLRHQSWDYVHKR